VPANPLPYIRAHYMGRACVRTQTKTNFAAIKLFETKKDTEYQQTKRGLG
jgi:hypothetical protein